MKVLLTYVNYSLTVDSEGVYWIVSSETKDQHSLESLEATEEGSEWWPSDLSVCTFRILQGVAENLIGMGEE